MRFLLADIAGGPNSYDLNDLVERSIAKILTDASGLHVTDFGTGIARAEFDFNLGGMPVELKCTSGTLVPVETYKDQELTMPSGLTSSSAAWFIYVMDGLEAGKGCGKLRAYSTKDLRNAVRNKKVGGYPSFYPGATPSQGALVHYMDPYAIQDQWLGNCDKISDSSGRTIGYDLSTWRADRSNAGDRLRNMVNEYHQDIKDRDWE